MTLDDLKHAQRERVIFLDRCLTWRRQANRKDLSERFGISAAQAALDFRTYLELSGSAPPIYDPVRKSYFAAIDHRPLVPSGLTEAFDILAEGRENSCSAVLPKPERTANPNTIAHLYRAIRSNSAVLIHYTSMSSGADKSQWIAPTRFISDGESVYVRAFSDKRGEFRNYLPIRIEPESSFEERSLVEQLPQDEDWNTRAIIWLRPALKLSASQASVVRREFGFQGEFLRVETRKALGFFFDRRWGLGTVDARLEREKVEYLPCLAED